MRTSFLEQPCVELDSMLHTRPWRGGASRAGPKDSGSHLVLVITGS